MASKKNRARASKDTNPRKYKKKTSALITEKVEYVDYKDVDLLSRFMSDRAKIRNRRVSGNDVQQQREVAGAIKIAREMALLPYTRRVATQRTRPPRDGRPGRERDLEGAPGPRPAPDERKDQELDAGADVSSQDGDGSAGAGTEEG
jgi:small subunit ribosomal protein S18